jgi:hypothetical protein
LNFHSSNQLLVDSGAEMSIFSNKDLFSKLKLGEVNDVKVITANRESM